MGRTTLEITNKQRSMLENWAEAHPKAHVRVRASIILGSAEGATQRQLADELGVSPSTVSTWRKRWREAADQVWNEQPMIHPDKRKNGKVIPGASIGRSGGLAAISDAPAPRTAVSAEKEREVVRLYKQTRPQQRADWTQKLLGKRVGLSASTVSRILRDHNVNLRPDRHQASRNPYKLTEVRLTVPHWFAFRLQQVAEDYGATVEEYVMSMVTSGVPDPAHADPAHEVAWGLLRPEEAAPPVPVTGARARRIREAGEQLREAKEARDTEAIAAAEQWLDELRDVPEGPYPETTVPRREPEPETIPARAGTTVADLNKKQQRR